MNSILLTSSTGFGDEMTATQDFVCVRDVVPTATSFTRGITIFERGAGGEWERSQSFSNVDFQVPVDGPLTSEGNLIIGGTSIHDPKVLQRDANGWSVVGSVPNTLAVAGTSGLRKLLLHGDWLVAQSRGVRNPQGQWDQALMMYHRNAAGDFEHVDTIFGRENGVPYGGGGEYSRRFGWSFAFDGDRLLVASAISGHDGTGLGGGAVFIFEEQATGWERTGIIQNPTGPTAPLGEQFGLSMLVEGNRLFIGAPFAGPTSQYRTGRVDVFDREGTEWRFSKSILPSVPWGGTLDQGIFGFSLAYAEDTLFVGSQVGQLPSANGDQHSFGTTYAFRECGGRWHGAPFVTAQQGWGQSAYGHFLAAAGGKVLTSAHQRDMVVAGQLVFSVGAVVSADIALLEDPCDWTYGRSFCGGETQCPCGPGSVADEGCPNSSGTGAKFQMTGYWVESTVQRAEVTGLPPNTICALFYGDRLFNPPPPAATAGAGLLCLQAPALLAISQANGSGAAYFTDEELPHPPPVFGDPGLRPLQVLYRDRGQSACPLGRINTSNALMVPLDDY